MEMHVVAGTLTHTSDLPVKGISNVLQLLGDVHSKCSANIPFGDPINPPPYHHLQAPFFKNEVGFVHVNYTSLMQNMNIASVSGYWKGNNTD